MIHELIVSSLNSDGSVHIAPMGIREKKGLIVIAPFKPSTTLDNIQRQQSVVINMTDNVQVFAGCLTGRRDWPTRQAEHIEGRYLDCALTHQELEVVDFIDDELRPEFHCRPVHTVNHQAFRGFNRAQAAVLEAAILVSRLQMLPAEKIQREIDYHKIAIDKTAGELEREAWDWLMAAIEDYQANEVKS